MRRAIAHAGRISTALVAAGLMAGAAPAFGGKPVKFEPRPLVKMSGPALLAKLEQGKSQSFVDVTSPVVVKGSFTSPFECTACTFEHSFQAEDAVFDHVVDLRGSTFVGQVDMKGATFEAPVLLVPVQDLHFRTLDCAARHRRHPKRDCLAVTDFQAPVSFSVATFQDVVDSEGVTFEMPVDYSLARFEDEADFSTTTFSNSATFRRARFGKAATFLGARLNRLQFDYVRSIGPLDFSNATFDCTKSADVCQGSAGKCTKAKAICRRRAARLATLEESPDALFDYSVVGELSYDNTIFQPGAKLSMTVLQASDLVLDPVDVGHVAPADRERILGLIETGAKSTNDLGVANEAHYRLQASSSTRYVWPLHVLDYVFYRSMAGYLVEPLQPLLTLLALALLVSLLRQLLPASRRRRLRVHLRIVWQRRRLHIPRPHLPRIGRWPKQLPAALPTGWRRLSAYLHELLDTLMLMWPGSGASQAGRRIEANAYRILFVCMLFGFANSNPTLRQMLDALR